jgi:hypothetical protein
MKKPSPTILCRFEFEAPEQHNGYAYAEFFVNEKRLGWHSVDPKTKLFHGSFKRFKIEFIRKVQMEYILDYIGNTGQVVASSNYVAEFWTPEFILRVADSLRRPRMRSSNVNSAMLKLYLKGAWNSRLKLHNMTRRELADHLNKVFRAVPKITPAAAWQRAYNLGLYSKRKSGPKERPAKQTASRL